MRLMTTVILFVLGFFLLFPRAQGQSVAADVGGLQRMSIEQVLLLANGLKGLDGFKLPQEARLRIAENLIGIRHMVDSYTATREAMITQHARGGAKVPDEEIALFNAEDRKVLQQVVEIRFYHIKRADLDLDHNNIPPTVLAAIWPILD